jgi:hypothetical protein
MGPEIPTTNVVCFYNHGKNSTPVREGSAAGCNIGDDGPLIGRLAVTADPLPNRYGA